MHISLIKLLVDLVMWLVKFLFSTASEESQEVSQKKASSLPPSPQMYRQPAVQQTAPLRHTYQGLSKNSSLPKMVTRRPIAAKPSPPTRPISRNKLAQVLGRCSTLRRAIVVSELLQPKHF